MSSGGTSSGGTAPNGVAGEGGASDRDTECLPRLSATVRDFRADHPDMESESGLIEFGCGMVESKLGEDGKPVFLSGGSPLRRVVEGDSPNFTFIRCEEWMFDPSWPDTVESRMTFDQCYRDVTDVNQAFDITLPLEEGNYDSSAFFPVDGKGFGNEDRPHNYHFTTEVHARFTYETGQTVNIRGEDDIWLFINERLVIDLGGTHAPIEHQIALDELAEEIGLVPGEKYSLDLFHAERHTFLSNFRFISTIPCFESE